ncbi:hypothetical protein TNCV_2817401 [Trichonephila clavipes]|nr:hypothetical protein TNCV_2817401 [Trichonephila clavipes]
MKGDRGKTNDKTEYWRSTTSSLQTSPGSACSISMDVSMSKGIEENTRTFLHSISSMSPSQGVMAWVASGYATKSSLVRVVKTLNSQGLISLIFRLCVVSSRP